MRVPDVDLIAEKIYQKIKKDVINMKIAISPNGRHAIYNGKICMFWGINKNGMALVEIETPVDVDPKYNDFRYHFEEVDPKCVEIIEGHDEDGFTAVKVLVSMMKKFGGEII